MFVRDSESTNRYMLRPNPEFKNGKCSSFGKLEKGYVRIRDFDSENPQGVCGSLYEPDMIVIPDNSIKFTITFPLLNPIEIKLESDNPSGFTLAELLTSIKELYSFVYEEEERTAPEVTYNIRQPCPNCSDKNINEYTTTTRHLGVCPICREEGNEEGEDDEDDKNSGWCKLVCTHIFHRVCITNWLKNKNTCPLCRNNIYSCGDCDGSGDISVMYTGIVIPVERRGYILNRNRTYGMFGIHSFDLEDLIIDKLQYSREKKMLEINIGS
jgi:hypothetical protein